MKRLQQIAFASVLAVTFASTALAGNIEYGNVSNASGNIEYGYASNATGNIEYGKAVTAKPGNIEYGRATSTVPGNIEYGFVNAILTLLGIC